MIKRKYLGYLGVLMLTGCAAWQPPEEPTKQVPASPFAEARKPPPTRASYSPASQETSQRVLVIKDQLAGKNPQYGIRPYALAIGSPQSEIFHVENTIYITEGLVRQCGTDQALAAALA